MLFISWRKEEKNKNTKTAKVINCQEKRLVTQRRSFYFRFDSCTTARKRATHASASCSSCCCCCRRSLLACHTRSLPICPPSNRKHFYGNCCFCCCRRRCRWSMGFLVTIFHFPFSVDRLRFDGWWHSPLTPSSVESLNDYIRIRL